MNLSFAESTSSPINRVNVGSTKTYVKVTLGLCVKNSAATISEAIKSIFEQDFSHSAMELIVVEGYSQDETLEIIRKKLAQTDIRTKIYLDNKGLGAARQIVVDNANAEYIIWVDGDLILSRSFVREQVEFMDQHSMVGIAKGKYGSLGKWDRQSLVEILENVEFMLNTVSEKDAGSMCLATAGCIYRMKALRQVGGFDPCVTGAGEDLDAENRIRQCGWQLFVTSALFYETRRATWKSLWAEYFWLGTGGRQLFQKNSRVFSLQKFLPPIAILVEMLKVPVAYKLVHQREVVLLPLQYVFKRSAWFLGFVMNRKR